MRTAIIIAVAALTGAGVIFGWIMIKKSGTAQVSVVSELAQTERALSGQPGNFASRLRRANQLIDLGDVENARVSARAMGVGAQSASDHYKLGRLFMRLADYPAAEDQFSQIKDDPQLGALVLTHRAENFARAGDARAAQEILQTGPDNPARLYIRARLAHSAGKLDDARARTANLLNMSPQDARYWALLAGIALDQQDVALASRAANAMRRSARYQLRADLVDIAIALREGRVSDAQIVFTALEARYPKAPIMAAMRGDVAMAQANPGDAVEAYGRAVSVLPAGGLRTLRLAAARFAQGDYAQADLLLQKARAATPGNWIAEALAIDFQVLRPVGDDDLATGQTVQPSMTDTVTTLDAAAPGPEQALMASLALAVQDGNWKTAHEAIVALSDFGMQPIEDVLAADQVLFGPYSPLFDKLKHQRAAMATLQHALRLRRSGHLEKAYATVTAAMVDTTPTLTPLYSFLAAEFALDLFRPGEAKHHLKAAEAQTGQTLLGALLRARILGGAGDHAGRIAFLLRAADQFGPQAKDQVLKTLVTMGEGAKALTLFRMASPDDFGAEGFAALVRWCLPRGTACLAENSKAAQTQMIAGFLQVSGTYTGTAAGDATLIMLKEALVPTQPDWGLYRAFYDAHGRTIPGRERFVALVAKARRWREARRFVLALKRNAGSTYTEDEALFGLLLEESLNARRRRRVPNFSKALAAFPDHPAALAAIVQTLSQNGITRGLQKTYREALMRGLSAGVDFTTADMDGVHLVQVLMANHTPAEIRGALLGTGAADAPKNALAMLAHRRHQPDWVRRRALAFIDAALETAREDASNEQPGSPAARLRHARRAFFSSPKTAKTVADYADALERSGFVGAATQLRGQLPQPKGGPKGA
ncbi:MAG: tetratricopeptide repeat protein [Pseudomonadota bacterium]